MGRTTQDKYKITYEGPMSFVIEEDPHPVLKTMVFRFESQHEFDVFNDNVLKDLNMADHGFELVAIEDGDKLDDEQ